MIEDNRVAIAAREAEKAALVSDSDLGVDDKEQIAEIDTEIAALKEKLAGVEAEWASEQAIVDEIREHSARSLRSRKKATTLRRQNAPELRSKFDTLEAHQLLSIRDDIRAMVDEQSVASVVSDWTGIPVGRMVRGTKSKPC